jgi:predicted metal-dependent hydrolase
MKDLTVFFLLLIILAVFYLYLEQKALQVIYIEAYDGKKYLVRDQNDKQAAAKLLADIASNSQILVDYVYENRETFKTRKEDIERLYKNFRPDAISESSPNNNYTSYSINKGEKIVFCLRKKKGSHKNELMNLNTMMFVAIHELAHLMTKSIGHTPEFWDNMKFLLQQGIKKDVNVYEKQDFSNNPEQYCGMTITDSPLYS